VSRRSARITGPIRRGSTIHCLAPVSHTPPARRSSGAKLGRATDGDPAPEAVELGRTGDRGL
jgi:hypothetical protein